MRRYLQRPHGGSESRSWFRFEAALLGAASGAASRAPRALAALIGVAAVAGVSAAAAAAAATRRGGDPRSVAGAPRRPPRRGDQRRRRSTGAGDRPGQPRPAAPRIIALGRRPPGARSRALDHRRGSVAGARAGQRRPRRAVPGRLAGACAGARADRPGGGAQAAPGTVSHHRRALRVHRARHDVHRGAGARPRRPRGLGGARRGVTGRPPPGGRVGGGHAGPVAIAPAPAEPAAQSASAPVRNAPRPGPVDPGRPRCPACARRPPVAGCGRRSRCFTSVASTRRISSEPAGALATFEELRRRFPGGPLRAESDLSIVQLLAATGTPRRGARGERGPARAGLGPERAAELRLLRGNLYRQALGDLARPNTNTAWPPIGRSAAPRPTRPLPPCGEPRGPRPARRRRAVTGATSDASARRAQPRPGRACTAGANIGGGSRL